MTSLRAQAPAILHARPIGRRAVLRGAGIALALPALEAMRPRTARAASVLRKRFVVMFSPNGTIHPNWLPTGGETDFALSPILSPLESFKQDLVLIDGLYQQGGGGDGHQNGMGGMLTGQTLNPGPFAGGANSGSSGWANGASVDQRIAASVGASSRLRSLELGVQVGPADNWGRMCYAGPDQPVPPDDNPLRVFQRLFAATGSSQEEVSRLRARRRSVLDAVLGQFGKVSARVGSADRQRLDAHAASLRDIERRLDAQVAPSAACQSPLAPVPPAHIGENDAFPAVGKLQMDLLALALACDLTRVASLQWSRSVSQVRFTWLGINDAHHELSHLPDADLLTVDKLTRINRWYAEQLAYLLDKLATTQESDGTRLLDSTLLLWANELGKGNTHSRKLAPYVLAGRAGGALKTGRLLRYDGDPPHNDLLVSLLQAMDVPATTFGKSDWCRGPLPNLI